MKNKFKLFVWEGDSVLTDYSNGIIVVVAQNLKDALREVEKTCDCCLGSFPINDYKEYPLNSPKAFVCWGGS